MLDKIKAGTAVCRRPPRPTTSRSNGGPASSAAARRPGCPRAPSTEIFRTPKDATGSVEGASPAERIVFRVTEIKVPPLDPESADAKRFDEALRARIAEDLIAQYIARLRKRHRRHHQPERAEPGHRRRQPELSRTMQIEPHGRRLRRALRARRSAGGVDHAGRRSRNAGLGLPEDRRRPADELSAGVGRRRRGARPLFGDRARSRPGLADERRARRDQPRRRAAIPSALRLARSRRLRRCAR